MGNATPIGRLGPSALMTLCASIVAFPSQAGAQVAQMQIDSILHDMKPEEVALRRAACAMGRAPKLAADARAAAFERPDASL